MKPVSPPCLPKVCAVSYLNTAPLTWGLMHGPQAGMAELSFAIPSECAARVESGMADIGLIPVGALIGQTRTIYPGVAIACRGPVRSILLISRVPPDEIRSLALDSSSRTSVLLARILLAQKWGVEPALKVLPPDLDAMLAACDACLIIGDPALALDPLELEGAGLRVFDAGTEWVEMTGLPMVFAVWAGRPNAIDPAVFVDSLRYGKDHLDEIVRRESAARGFSPELTRSYLTDNVIFELGEREQAGMRRYMEYASELLRPAPLAMNSL